MVSGSRETLHTPPHRGWITWQSVLGYRIDRTQNTVRQRSMKGTTRGPAWLAGSLLCAIALVASAGCATPAPRSADHQASAAEDPPSRAERVFRYQSRVADALLDRYPLLEVFADADPALIAAERKMTDKCSPLTRAMLSRLEGEPPSLGLRFKVLTSIDDCERAARKIDRLLNASSSSELPHGSI